jgi:deoxyribose-phosphate aldolase
MNTTDIMRTVDHTLLKAASSWAEIKALCDEALNYQTASVCVPPSYVKRIHETYGDQLNICIVVGFPLGYSVTAAKELEIIEAKKDGASEFDMVVNLGDVKNGDFDKVTEEIRTLKKAAGDAVLKVIIETCYLTESEKIALCDCVTKAGADYIKTSTGFGTGGATLDDILLFKKHIGPNVKTKAAGGIKTRGDMVSFIENGCSRLGTSSAVKILMGDGQNNDGSY